MKHRVPVLILLAAMEAGCRQSPPLVAEAGSLAISKQEFADRYRKYLEQTGVRDNIQQRKQVVSNMINEKLIFDDLTKRGLDRDSAAQTQFEDFRKRSYLIGYAKMITLDTMALTEEELQKEFIAYNTKVDARYLYAPSEEEAWSLREELESGATFDSLAKTIFEDPGLANNGGYLGTFGWGEMEPALEQTAMTIPVGSLSDPVKLRMGYAIVKVEHRVRQPLVSEADYGAVKPKLATAVQKKKIADILRTALNRVRDELKPEFDPKTMSELVTVLGLNGNKRLNFQQVESGAGNLLSRPFVKFGTTSWTFEEFLRKYAATSRRRLRTEDDLKDAAVGLAARDVMLRKAEEAHVERDSTVVGQMELLKTRYLLKRWRSSVEDTVGSGGVDETALRAKYRERSSDLAFPEEVNVAEILLRTKEEAAAVMKELRRGADFSELARKKSIRLWAAKQGGELGYGPKSTYGALGDTLFRTPVGGIVGPSAVDPYVGIFKVIGKKPGRLKTFEEARKELSDRLIAAGKQEALRRSIETLRNRVPVVVHEDVLGSIDIK